MPHSSIAWKQIGAGYLICGCVFLGALSGLLLPARHDRGGGGEELLGLTVILLVAAAGWALRRLWRLALPRGLPDHWQEPLKTAAVLLLALGSASGTAILARLLWQAQHV